MRNWGGAWRSVVWGRSRAPLAKLGGCFVCTIVDCPSDLNVVTTVRARKAHTCCECDRTIEAREHYDRCVCITHGEAPSTYRQCAQCAAVCSVLVKYCGQFIYTDVLRDVREHAMDYGVRDLLRVCVLAKRGWMRKGVRMTADAVRKLTEDAWPQKA